MLREAKINYTGLLETSNIAITIKKGKKKFKLKKVLVIARTHLNKAILRDESTLYYAGSNITHSDLKLRNHTGTELLSRYQLVYIAKRGLRDYRKAMAFAGDK